jgi:hypothetical protein
VIIEKGIIFKKSLLMLWKHKLDHKRKCRGNPSLPADYQSWGDRIGEKRSEVNGIGTEILDGPL